MLSNIVFLHQTTTIYDGCNTTDGCQISSFYIKPQRSPAHCLLAVGCQISSFYIKPQHSVCAVRITLVVKYRLSTSNHNDSSLPCFAESVVKYRLSTSNHNEDLRIYTPASVVKYRLSTSNHNLRGYRKNNYIVVKYRLSTSNHNPLRRSERVGLLSNIVFLHQTTTLWIVSRVFVLLSNIVFLHQTTTRSGYMCSYRSCQISSFYIKPQLPSLSFCCDKVVKYRLSTSNHNG